jgi:cation diffusion facilitator family transporter
MKKEKPIAVYSAITANLLIAAMKYIVSFVTGSSAMLAEAIHSSADTGNELLLLLGVRRSQKAPNAIHPFGYGRELYFWGLIVAILLFSSGAGMSIYEGLTHLSHPEKLKSPGWNYAVLGFAFLADGTSWVVAFRNLLKVRKPHETIWHSIRSSKDPSVFIVLGEDNADLAGLLVAFLGIYLGELLHNPYLDVIASLLVGAILIVVALFLVYESKSLLIGETADRETLKAIRELVEKHPAVTRSKWPLSMQLGPNEVFLALNVQFKSELSVSRLVKVIDELQNQIRQNHTNISEIFIEADGSE